MASHFPGQPNVLQQRSHYYRHKNNELGSSYTAVPWAVPGMFFSASLVKHPSNLSDHFKDAPKGSVLAVYQFAMP